MIRDCLVYTDTGICLLHRSFVSSSINPEVDSLLVTNFLSAIDNFALDIAKSGLQTIRLIDGTRFYAEKRGCLVFVFIVDNYEKESDVKRKLSRVAERVVEKVGIAATMKGDLFQPFDEEMEEIIVYSLFVEDNWAHVLSKMFF